MEKVRVQLRLTLKRFRWWTPYLDSASATLSHRGAHNTVRSIERVPTLGSSSTLERYIELCACPLFSGITFISIYLLSFDPPSVARAMSQDPRALLQKVSIQNAVLTTKLRLVGRETAAECVWRLLAVWWETEQARRSCRHIYTGCKCLPTPEDGRRSRESL